MQQASSFDFDLITIGGGSGGVRASRLAASHGFKAAVIEQDRFGGTCVNVGCIPKKLLSYAAAWSGDFDLAADYGWHLDEPRFDWRRLIDAVDREVLRLNGVYERLLREAGVSCVRGRARLVDGHTVAVDGRHYTARTILVATGAVPLRPPIPGAGLGLVSDDLFALERLPATALVVGGGYIALEFASILNGLGVETTLAYRGERLLRGFDADLGTRVAEEMQNKGVRILLKTDVVELSKADGETSVAARLNDGQRHEFGSVLFATGRRPNTDSLGLREAGVVLGANGQIVVDAFSRSSCASIHAIGDVTDRMNLTPVATAEAGCFVNTVFLNRPTPMNYDNVATAVFSLPNVATVGMSEQQALASQQAIDVYVSAFRSLKYVVTQRSDKVFMKLIVDRQSRRVLGAHMVGPDAGEIIQGFAAAMKAGITKEQLDSTVGIHPTVAEEFVTMRTKR
ncbi:MAG: glutathione-disulfide reductase [Burkholderiaceae bacterium]